MKKISLVSLMALTLSANAGFAAEPSLGKGRLDNATPPAPATAPPPPAPMGVFGADMPPPEKLVLSITPNFANLSGMRIGTRNVSNEYIVNNVPFFLNPTRTVRIVPQNIAAKTQVVGLAYGVTKDFSLVFTGGMGEKNLEPLTFSGAAGVQQRGRSYVGTVSLVDFSLSGIYRVYQDDIHRIQINLGFSFPTGSNHATFNGLLLPDGSRALVRAFYGMQPGTGTFDIMPGVVYAGHLDKWSWGLSYRGRHPLAANPQGYMWGNLHEFNGWAGYTWIPGLTTTFRALASVQGRIAGFDPEIRGIAAPTNPLFYGGTRVELFGGWTVSGKFIGFDNLTLAAEAGFPVHQDLNGPQIMKNWQAGMSLRLKI